jgi:hypothetical protein
VAVTARLPAAEANAPQGSPSLVRNLLITSTAVAARVGGSPLDRGVDEVVRRGPGAGDRVVLVGATPVAGLAQRDRRIHFAPGNQVVAQFETSALSD